MYRRYRTLGSASRRNAIRRILFLSPDYRKSDFFSHYCPTTVAYVVGIAHRERLALTNSPVPRSRVRSAFVYTLRRSIRGVQVGQTATCPNISPRITGKTAVSSPFRAML
jgi:hypothetical protein